MSTCRVCAHTRGVDCFGPLPQVWYTGLGSTDLLTHACGSIPTHLDLTCDGQPVQIPADVEGLVVLNIPSFMASRKGTGALVLAPAALPFQGYLLGTSTSSSSSFPSPPLIRWGGLWPL